MEGEDLRPRKRTKFRLLLGKNYYTLKRYAWWTLHGRQFAKTRLPGLLPHVYSRHRTPLIRQLKGTDLYLQYNKIANLKIAVKRLNGIVLEPGQLFSYWKLIGKPTRAKGYVEGMALFCGTVQRGVGGGLCQLSNLIYWMTLHTPLTVVERFRHSFDVFPDSDRTQPFGSGATCVYNYRDLIIRNDTRQRFQLCLKVTEGFLEGEWRSASEPLYRYRVYEKDHRIDFESWGGYTRHNVLMREICDREGNRLGEETVTSNHAVMMYQPFLAEKSAGSDAGEGGGPQ